VAVYDPVDALRQDFRYACRSLVARPGFALLAVLTLAIGIGVNAVAFSAVNALLLKPFRIAGSEALGWVMSSAPGDPRGLTSLPDYQDLARETKALDAVIAEGRMPVRVQLDGRTDERWAMLVSANYFAVLGERPETGRLFAATDLSGSEAPVLVSHRFWTDALGGGASLSGRTLVVNGRQFTVVGVIRDGFQGPGGLFEPSIWLPLERIDLLGMRRELQQRERGWLTVIGHRRPQVTDAQVEADLKAVFGQLARDYPTSNAERTGLWFSMRDGHPDLRGMAPAIWIALGVVSLVLLIACFNVAGLLLARAQDRQREIGVRAALGASRVRILRQLLTESAVLALLSGCAALVVAAWSADLLAVFSLPAPIPQRLHIGIDARLVGYTFGLVVVAAVLPALLPALQATRGALVTFMKAPSGGARPSRARSVFVVAQVAGSTLFVAGALLLGRSFANMASFDPGFDVAHTIAMELTPATYLYDAPRSRTFFTQLSERIAALPGVTEVALADRLPFYVGFPAAVDVSIDGRDCAAADCRKVTRYGVGAGHFAALGIPIRAGRDFTARDLDTGAAVVVSERMAAQFWPGMPAVGQSLRLGKEGTTAEVIGVVADITHRNPREAPGPYLYQPLTDADYLGRVTVAVRTSGDPRHLLGPVQEQVQAIDSGLPSRSAQTMAKRMEVPLWPSRTLAGFFLVCGSLALVLATVGLFGVTYYAVAQRTREFGVRMALGATPRKVVQLVLREGLRLTAPGVALGILGALIGARLLARALFGVSPGDPATFAATAALQAAVALAAAALPAYRATQADPIVALRQE
jgi:predicted permease